MSRIRREAYYRTPLRPGRGDRLIRVDVTFVNQTQQPIDPFCGGGNVELVDRDGHRNDPARGLYEIEGNDAVCSTKTEEGERATAILAFEIDGDDDVSYVDIWNGQHTADFNGEASRVRFRP